VSCYFLEATAFAKLFVQEQGTDELIRLMEAVEDNRKLISAEDATAALEILRMEAARMVQEPLNPAVLEAARQLLDRTTLRWPDSLQLAAAIVARDMFQGTEIIFVSASALLLEAAKSEGFHTLDPAKEAVAAVKESSEPAKEEE
jgi:predicted nucleic acid-binding protein